MPKVIDHEKRKEKILNAALKVFAREGYKDSNMSLISEECNLSRATVYQYFKDKEQIYYYAVKLITERMFQKYSVMVWKSRKDAIDTILDMCYDIMDYALQSMDSITNMVYVMLLLKKENRNFSEIIMRRTAKISILIKRLLLHGIRNGEVIECDIDKVTRHIVILIESYCFQIALLNTYNVDEAKEILTSYLDFFKINS